MEDNSGVHTALGRIEANLATMLGMVKEHEQKHRANDARWAALGGAAAMFLLMLGVSPAARGVLLGLLG